MAALRLLSLDGGGVRGYSELLILAELLKRVQQRSDLPEIPLPADYFDIIGGTSTGGLIAIMLGRLRMTIQEALEAYENLSVQIFGHRQSKMRAAMYSADNLAQVIKSSIRTKLGQNEGEDTMRGSEESKCKTFVCTVGLTNVQNVRLIRSYASSRPQELDCKIWEAARATCAAPRYFPPIVIGPAQEQFIDAGFGCNNPIVELHHEVESIYDSDMKIACIISIGTGLRKRNQIEDASFWDRIVPKQLIKAMKRLTVTSDIRAADMEARYTGSDDFYFRFNVEHGLEDVGLADAHKLGVIRTRTQEYMSRPSISAMMDRAAAAMSNTVNDEKTYTVAQISLNLSKIISATEKRNEGIPGPQDVFENWFQPGGLDTGQFEAHSSYLSKRFIDSQAGYKTASWFFETTPFQAFLTSANPVVTWVTGSKGCGKSVLAASIVEALRTAQMSDGKPALVLFHYCDNRHGTTPLDLVKSLIAQTARWNSPEIYAAMLAFKRTHDTLREDDIEQLQGIWGLLDTIISILKRKLYIVIDGIEACNTSQLPISELISTMLQPGATVQPSILFTTRLGTDSVFSGPLLTILQSQEPSLAFHGFDIEPRHTTKDIQAFVTYRVNRADSPFSSKSTIQRDGITENICSRANGMFLFATLIFDALKEEQIASEGAIEATLEGLPTTLDQIYGRYIEKLKHSEKGMAIVRWVFASMRSLSWDEMRHALAMLTGKYQEKDLIEMPCPDFVRLTCASLIQVTGADGKSLQFIHPTVRDYLNPQKEVGRSIGLDRAHSEVVKVLLAVLESPDVPDFARTRQGDPTQRLVQHAEQQEHKLFSYALMNWYKHLQRADKSPDPELEKQMSEFFSAPVTLRWLLSVMLVPNPVDTPTQEIDTSAFTREVIECVQDWALDRKWQHETDEQDAKQWVTDFLVLMLDWAHIIEHNPSDFFFIHYDLLPVGNRFRKYLERDSARTVVQFKNQALESRSSQRTQWLQYVFAADPDRGLAYALQDGILKCYHTATGLLASEAEVGSEDSGLGIKLHVTKVIMSPRNEYLALLIEATPLGPLGGKPSEMLMKIRDGLQLTTVATLNNPVAWRLENEHDQNETSELAEVYEVPRIAVSVVLFKLGYEGPMHKNTFGIPTWAPLPTIMVYTKPTQWAIDDNAILGFTPDSNYLRTNGGIIDLHTGRISPYQEGLNLLDKSRKGSTLTEDSMTVVSIRNRNSLEFLHVLEHSGAEEISFPGIGHLLATSNHGRYCLVMQVQTIQDERISIEQFATDQRSRLPRQQGTIVVFDRMQNSWTILLTLRPPYSGKHESWKIQNHDPPKFSPEECRARLMITVPRGWTLSENVQGAASLNEHPDLTVYPYLLIFDGDRYSDGFGSRPILRHVMPELSDRTSQDLVTATKILSWDRDLENAIVLLEGQLRIIPVHELHSIFSVTPSLPSHQEEQGDTIQRDIVSSATLATPRRDMMFRVQLLSSVHSGVEKSSDQISQAYDLHLQVLREHDYLPLGCSLLDIVGPKWVNASLDSLYISVSNERRIFLGPFEVDLQFMNRKLKACEVAEETRIFPRVINSFAITYHPLEVPLAKYVMSTFVEQNQLFRLAIFEHGPSSLEAVRSMKSPPTNFMAVGSATNRSTIHVYQFSRLFQPGQVDGTRRREARSFEIFLTCFDTDYDQIVWMTHTWSGGSMKESEELAPKCAWALHPTLPLLVWAIPGHKVRISSIKSHDKPVNIAEPVVFEVDELQAFKFSPNGKYLLAQTRLAYMNTFWPEQRRDNQKTIMLFNLVTGMRTSLLLGRVILVGRPISIIPVSIDLDDEHVKVLRLTSNHTVELNLYKLPDLIEMERFDLTSIPLDCCCATCGKPFFGDCKIALVKEEAPLTILIGHGELDIGAAPVSSSACEPLILRISKPMKSVKISPTDTLITGRSFGTFPAFITEEGRLRADVFSQSSETGTDDFFLSDPEELIRHLSIDEIKLPSQVKQMLPQMNNYWDEVKKEHVLHEDVEANLRRQIVRANNILRFGDESEDFKRGISQLLHDLYGDDFPFDDWDDFVKTMRELDDPEMDLGKIFDDIYEEGSGVGCKIPVFVQTFNFQGMSSPDMNCAWSSAADIGWIEEDIGWFYRRLCEDTLENSRDWYPFERLGMLYARMDHLSKSTSEEGIRYRKWNSAWTAEAKPLPSPQSVLTGHQLRDVGEDSTDSEYELEAESDGSSSQSSHSSQKKKRLMKKEVHTFDTLLRFQRSSATAERYKDYRKHLSDLSPGLGQALDYRIQSFLARSFENELA